MVIFPDGREQEISRPGRPTILEQKGILRRAAGLKADILVAELMSVRPEILAVEARRLVRPDIVVITNVRVDHRDEMGRTKPEIARGLAEAVAAGSTVFVPEDEAGPEFERAASEAGARLIAVRGGGLSDTAVMNPRFSPQGFEADIALALAVSGYLGVGRDTALSGFGAARPDFGSLRAWDAVLGDAAAPWTLVNAFAANDPESSRRALDRLDGLGRNGLFDFLAVLNLRDDRGDRTLQWIEALEAGFFAKFAALYVVGAHTRARRWRRWSGPRPALRLLHQHSAENLMAAIVRDHPAGAVLVGLGNMGGLGRLLVEHWETIGRPHVF